MPPGKSPKRNSSALSKGRPLKADFFSRPALAVARDLLGKFLVRRTSGGIYAAMITETEAYTGPRDLASHSSKGRTPRTEVMFGPPGYWYVYFTYGMHWLLNAVTAKEGHASAVLIRGLAGTSGPARITRKLGIGREFYGQPIKPASGLWIEDTGVRIPGKSVRRTPRIGVDYAGAWAAKPYRFVINKEHLTAMEHSHNVSLMQHFVAIEKKSKKTSGGGQASIS